MGKLALYTEGVAQFSVLMLQYLAVQGVAGGVWFAAGAVIQIFFFGIVAVEIKRRAPTAHTVLEIVAIRWGNKARVVCPTSELVSTDSTSAKLVSAEESRAVMNCCSGPPLQSCKSRLVHECLGACIACSSTPKMGVVVERWKCKSVQPSWFCNLSIRLHVNSCSSC